MENKNSLKDLSAKESGWVAKIDSVITRAEKRVSTAVVSIFVGVVLMGLTHLYVAHAPFALGHGGGYFNLSVTPFNFQSGGALQNRILTPLLAHYSYFLPFFRNHDYVLFLDIIGSLFLCLVYIATRREGLSPWLSVMAAAVMAFSAPILFFLRFVGYTDITSYTLIFLAMMTVRNNLIWPWMLALSLFNHENNFFAFPWFGLFYYLRNERKISRSLIAALLMGVAVLPWYWWVSYVASQKPPTYTVSYYLSLSVMSQLGIVAANMYTGFFQAFKLFWVLPAYAMWVHLRQRNFAEAMLYLMIVGCATAQLCLAFDTSRLFTAAFPVIWLGFVTLAKNVEKGMFVKYMSHLFVINIFVPQYYVGADKLIQFYSPAGGWILKKFFNINIWEL